MQKIVSVFVLTLLILLPLDLYAARPDFMMKDMGFVSGRVIVDGKPVLNSIVAFFHTKNGLPPIEGGMRRVPEFLTRSDTRGRFEIRLFDGEYYIGILLRKPEGGSGPPREGEKFYFAGTENGALRSFSISQNNDLNLGNIYGFASSLFVGKADFFTVEGIVRDENGDPFPGVVVLGKSQLNIPRPGFISQRTAVDGFYSLKLPASRGFYLVTREAIAGGRPSPGNYVGTYGIKSTTGLATPSIFSAGSPPPGVLAEDTGSRALIISGSKDEVISGVDIFMYEVPDPEVIKASIQGTTGAPKFETGTILNDILFKPNSTELDENSYKELDRWVSFLKGKEEMDIELAGHADNIGTVEQNKTSSEKRAKTVEALLIEKGINPLRLIVVGHGSEHPIASNDSEDGRRKNRRVEIKFISRRIP